MYRSLLILFLLFSSYAFADDSRLHSLYKKVKCPTCAGQTIDESNTKSAEILKGLINLEVENGMSDEQILDEIRAYYGDEIVLETKPNERNMLIWLLPTLLLIYSLNRVYRIYKAK